MKRILALFLAVTLLLGVVGTAAAAEMTATPEITAPTIKSATIDADGNVTVTVSGVEFEDGQYSTVYVNRPGYGNYGYSLVYSEEKKAFVLASDYSKDQIKGGEIYQITIRKNGTSKTERSGKTTTETGTETSFNFNKELKLTQAQERQYENSWNNSTGETISNKSDYKREYYNTTEGYLYQKQTSTSTTDYTKTERTESSSNESVNFSKDGEYTGTNKNTNNYVYDRDTNRRLSYEYTSEYINKDGKTTSTSKNTTTTTYNKEKIAEATEYTEKTTSEGTSNNEYGVLIATREGSGTTAYKRDAVKNDDGTTSYSSWKTVESDSESTRKDKDGKVVYSSTSSTKDGVTKTETKSYDQFGALESGYTSTNEKLKNHYEYSNRFGKTEEGTTEYEAVKDADGNQTGSRTKTYTYIYYGNYKGGENVKSSEYVSKPEYKKLESGSTRTLTHTSNTSYDKYGAVTSTETVDESYDEEKNEIVQKSTTVNYVGKPVAAEMHDKIESIYVRKVAERTSGNTTAVVETGDYTNTTTYYDWDDSVERKVVQSREVTKDDSGNELRTTVDRTYSDDEKTVVSGSKEVEGADKNGRYYRTYDWKSSDGSSYTSENRYDEETESYVYTATETDSEGWSSVYRSDADGDVTTYYDPDKKVIGKFTPNAEEIRKNGQLVSISDKYTDADGKLVYEIRDNWDKDGNYTGITYHDADGKEIGFENSKSGYNDDETVYTSTETHKEPVFDTHAFALTGAWEESSREYTETTGSDGKITTKSSGSRKNYNEDGKLTYETEYTDDNGEYSNSEKEYTEKGALRYAYTYDKNGSVTTYYDNPGNVLSKVINRPANKTKEIASTNFNGTVVTESVNSDTSYYNLEGKLDRQFTDTYKYEYSDEGNTTKVIRTSEYKDASGSAVVTKTETTDYTDGYKYETETKTKDGTVIGYNRSKTDKDAKTQTSEQLTPSFNPYTGYVFSSELVKTTSSTESSNQTYTRTTEKKNHDGEVTYSQEQNTDKDGNSKTVTKNYTTFEDGSLRPSSETTRTYDAKTKKTESTTVYYRWSGAKLRSNKTESAYDAEKDLTVSKTEYFNSDDELVYTAETSRQTKAYGEGSTTTISQTVYTDAKGNEIGYSKVGEDGAVESKTPNTSNSGNLTGAYTLSTTSADGKVTTSKSYDKDGLLIREEYSDNNAFTSSSKTYWAGSSTVKEAEESSEDSTGMTTTTTTYYGEGGDQRRKVETVSGRKTGTHFYTDTEKHYNSAGALVYTHEIVTDYQKDETTDVYKDASGKEIGYGRTENEDGSWSQKTPNTAARTGEITGFYEDGVDENGFWYDVSYDKDGKETWRYDTTLDDDGNRVTSYYNNGSKTPTYYTVYGEDNMATTYDASGEMLYAQQNKWYSDGIAQNSTSYYNQKGELVYTRLEEVSDGYRTHTVYLDADGKVIAERELNKDNGDSYDKYPYTTYANNITGYYEYESKDNGKTWTERWYDEDNKLKGESARTTATTQTDDSITRTVADGQDRKMSVTVTELDEDNNYTKATTTSFSRWNGAVTGRSKTYYEDGYTARKNYDKNGNVTTYGYDWTNDDWSYSDYYWVNGNQSSYSWDDDLDEQGYYNSSYYPTGAVASESYGDGNGYSYYRNYNAEGKLTYNSETKDGVTNTTWYDADGNITGYDWGGTSSWVAGKNISDSTIWDTDKVIYERHTESDPEGGEITTWKDPAGNVKVISDNEGTTVTFASAGDGWKQAFGNEWYYVEGGKPVTGWKMIGGVWYFFYSSGEMATGLVRDGNSLYAMNKDGAWVASGWNADAYGNYNYVDASGNAVTGWKLIDGKWYYFTDGWYIREDPQYDSDVGWSDGGSKGYMVTGAYDIWNGDWTDTMTYFFNKDGSWDTTPGWKNDGINWFYFSKGGDRAIGWKQINGVWYYFNEKGIMRNGWVGSGNTWYYLNENGDMADNEWIQERFEDTWYYADKGGAMATGWRDINGVWYYFNADGDMASEQWVDAGGAWYYLNKNGDMATGWAKDGDTWYYMDENGVMQTGWVQLGGAWYYLNANGEMVTGQQTIDGVVSNFDDSGVWLGYAE